MVKLYNPYAGPEDLPIVGPWVARIGRVIEITSMPCMPHANLWVKAAFYAAPKALWALFGPDCLDQKIDLYKPTAGGSKKGMRPHYKIKRGTKFYAKLTEDPWLRPDLGKVGWAVWRFGEVAQRVGWWVAVADVTTDFLVNWTSLAYQWEGCLPGPLEYANANSASTAVIAPGPQTIVLSINYDPQGYFFVASWTIPAGVPSNFAVAGKYKPYTGPGGPLNGRCNFQVENLTTGVSYPPLVSVVDSVDPNQGGAANVYQLGTHQAAQTYRLRAVNIESACDTSESEIIILGQSTNGLGLKPSQACSQNITPL